MLALLEGQGFCAVCPEKSSCILGPLEEDERRRIIHLFQIEPKGQIFQQGMPILGWYILCRGKAKLVLRTPRGKSLILRFCKSGDILNLWLLGSHHFSAETIKRCFISFVNRHDVLPLLREHPELWEVIWRWARFWEETFVQQIESLVALSVRERLVRVLLKLEKEHGLQEGESLRIDLPLSLRDVAKMIGASPQTTCQELRALVNKGLLKISWPTIFILNPRGMRQFLFAKTRGFVQEAEGFCSTS